MQKPINICGNHSIKSACILILFIFQLAFLDTKAQDTHPHIFVSPADKSIILDKIKNQEWAKNIFETMQRKVAPYVEKHQQDPEWMLSRYLMNRIPGKRYTSFYSDAEGTKLLRYGGDAPYPTVRVAPHKRPPVSDDGHSYEIPSIEELVPYDTSILMLLKKTGSEKKEWVNPQTLVDNINGEINQMALDAAIIYWLTGKTEYAKFSADILSQWVRGAYYQNPIEGPCRTGFLSIQTLGDGSYEPLPLVYDFVYDYLREKKYETSWYEPVFQKIANTMTFRGFWNNNWFAAQKPMMVFAALSLEDKKMREYFVDFYLNKDTINGACGHLSMPTLIKEWLTPDGHWKEPGGYHNFPVSSILISAMALEKNAYGIFNKYPALFGSTHVMLKYSFPNLRAPSIGDTGPATQSAECLEIGLAMAEKYGSPVAGELTSAINVLINQNGYKRSSSDYLGLLTYLPTIQSKNNLTYTWPRSGELDFAKCYEQRNGMEKETGLMYAVQGATYNHNHANGMSMELYGAGTVMGPDPGKGITYEAPMHVKYYAQWAAHNTVVAGGISASNPYFKGGGGTKKIGEISLAAMEPKSGREAISPQCSFTDTRYVDIVTNAKQQRTMAIIRTSETSGYYVDIYRSAHPKSNEYLYHNVGSGLKFLDGKRAELAMKPAEFPITKKPLDPPGFSAIKSMQSIEKIKENVVALFSVNQEENNKTFMQVLFAGEGNRVFYAGKAPQTKTADIPYRNLETPTLIARQEGEAWTKPFVAIYEPFSGSENFTVTSIETIDKSDPGRFTALMVKNKNNANQLVFQCTERTVMHAKDQWKFKGNFGVVSLQNNQLQYIYLGDGTEVSYGNYGMSAHAKNSSAQFEIKEGVMTINCNQETMISLPATKTTKAYLTTATEKIEVKLMRIGNRITLTVPATKNGLISFN